MAKIPKCGRLSRPAHWSTFGRIIKQLDFTFFTFIGCTSALVCDSKAPQQLQCAIMWCYISVGLYLHLYTLAYSRHCRGMLLTTSQRSAASSLTPRRLRSADTRTLLVSRTRTNFGDRAFNAAGPQVCNYLSTELGQPDLSYSRFRRSLMTFLFDQQDQSAVVNLPLIVLQKSFYSLAYSFVVSENFVKIGTGCVLLQIMNCPSSVNTQSTASATGMFSLYSMISRLLDNSPETKQLVVS